MKFRTEINIKDYREGLTLVPMEGVTCIGSCFAGNIALKMRQSLWEAATPFGALYNPLSIAKVFHIALAKEEDRIRLINESIFEHGGILHTWLGDSSFSARSREQVTQNILSASESLRSSLHNDRISILTFGTAWCYFLSETPDAIVANCHKLPSSKFIRRRISVEEILSVWRRLLKQLKEQFPRLEIILTVSPVRHLKDGMTGNNLSKAILHLAVEELCAEYPFCHYFPAYEIMMDDLRDYRFYASDLSHPSEEALDYIWEKFQECYIEEEGRKTLKEGDNIYRGLAHRSILETEEERSARIASLEKRKAALIKRP